MTLHAGTLAPTGKSQFHSLKENLIKSNYAAFKKGTVSQLISSSASNFLSCLVYEYASHSLYVLFLF